MFEKYSPKYVSYAVGGSNAGAFYPLWNLDYKIPAGNSVCWRFSFFQKRYIPLSVCVCVCSCMCVLVLLSTIYQAAIHCEFPPDLKMDPVHITTMVKYVTSLLYAFLRLPNTSALVCPPLSGTNLQRGCLFVWRCETRARHRNTQHCPSSGSVGLASLRPVSLWRQGPFLQ